MKKVYILASMLLMGQTSWAQIREFQTSRLQSTAGAGIASVLSNEAAILNPASSAFFNGSSFSYQTYSTSLRHENDDRELEDDDFPSQNISKGVFISEHTGQVKGGFAYLKQDENNYERSQLVGHSSAPIGSQSSLGFAYKYIQDVLPKGSSPRHKTGHQLSLGAIHILDNKTVIGLVWVDPTRATKSEERVVAGFQYSFAEKLSLIADIGTQYTKDVKDKHLWRAAIQLQLFDDFFFRVGKFYDNIRETKGNGWGVGWIGPRLGVEFSQKFSDQFGKEYYVYQDETLVDTAISAVIKF